MKYKIIVDKQPRTNPSNEKKIYEIDIEELRYKGDVHDSLIITKDEDYVIRRLSLSEYYVLSVLDKPKKEPLEDINIELFEGDNYIYLMDMTGNSLYAEYLIKNEFSDLYVLNSEMHSAINQKADEIDLSVNKKLEGYSTTEEMNAEIKLVADAITSAVSEVEEKADSAAIKVEVKYAISNSETTAPTAGWSITAPTWQAGKYIWQKTITTYANGTKKESDATNISGYNGKDGATGKGIKALETQYYLSTSRTTQEGGSWKTTQDKWEEGKYIWSRTKITWSDNTVTYTTPICDVNLNEVHSEIKQTADEIKTLITKSVGSLNLLQDSNFIKDNDVTAFWTFMRNYASEEIIKGSESYNWLSINYLYNSSGMASKFFLTQRISNTSFAKGEYTLSFDYQSDNQNSFSISIAKYNQNGDLLKTKEFNNITLEATNATSRKVYTLNPEFDETVNSIEITITFLVSEWSNIKITKLQFQKGSVATDYSVSQMELYSSIDQQLEKISTEVGKKLDGEEFGTKITQDWQSVQIAWNKISEFIQFINAQLQIKDSNQKLLMALTQNGQYFYETGKYLGYIGTSHLKDHEDYKLLQFALSPNGYMMDWSARDNDNGDLILKWTYAKGGITEFPNEGLYAGTDIYMRGNKISLLNSNNNIIDLYKNVMKLKNVDFYIGWYDNDNYINFLQGGSLTCSGDIYGHNFSSDGRLKENIQESNINALEVIKQMNIRSFDWKKDKKHINAGFIAQEMEEIDSNFVLKRPIKDENTDTIIDYEYYINELPILATAAKAIQEQQEEIKELKNTIQEQQKVIEKIAERLEITIEKPTIYKASRKVKKQENIVFDGKIKKPIHKKIEPKTIKMRKTKNGIELLEQEGESNG